MADKDFGVKGLRLVGPSGTSGGVRIIWGPNRSFPSTNTGAV